MSGPVFNPSDPRYSIRREWCGEARRPFVVRFCGEWVGKANTRSLALDIARDHHARRWGMIGPIRGEMAAPNFDTPWQLAR